MLLVADSGSTKTDWGIIDDGHISGGFETIGMNPYFYTDQEILEILKREIPADLDRSKVQSIYFYGAGCSSTVRKNRVSDALGKYFTSTGEVMVDHDLLGAARALCGQEEGIATILGTGSNSCLYDGRKITMQRGGYGYILSDEGSGSYMGKRLIRDFLYDILPEAIKSALISEYQLDKEVVVDNVYRQPSPNRYLASFSKFFHEHLDHPYAYDVVYRGFDDFFKLHITEYPNYKNLHTHAVGSIGYHFSEILKKAAADNHLIIDRIIDKPLKALCEYHINVLKTI